MGQNRQRINLKRHNLISPERSVSSGGPEMFQRVIGRPLLAKVKQTTGIVEVSADRPR